jgi:predicted MPP superfamily phosphohydrolase
MSTNRRRFLIGAGLTGLGVAGVGKLLIDGVNSTAEVAAVAVPKSKLLQRFAVLADTGTGSVNQYAVARALAQYHQKNPFDTILLAGDNIYTNGEFTKIKPVFTLPYQDLLQRGVKFYASLGNHDVRSLNGDLQVAYPDFNMKGQRYYMHGQGDVRFFVLNTNDLINIESPERVKQLDWLDRALAASKAKWNIVYGHHNIYSTGMYPDNQVMIEDVNPILKKHKVRLWINGHDHNYQRWNFDQITYLVCGGGGAKLYEIKDETIKKHPHHEKLKFAKSIYSFGIIEVYQDQIMLTGMNSQGEIIDRGWVNLT